MSQRRPPRDPRPLHQTADLTAVWHAIVTGEPFRFRSLWLLFLDEGRRPVGPVLTLDHLPDGPYDVQRADLVGLCDEILSGPGGEGARGGSVAMLLTRPEGAPWTVSDRAWGRFLLAAADETSGRAWPVHWAHRGLLEEFRLVDRRRAAG